MARPLRIAGEPAAPPTTCPMRSGADLPPIAIGPTRRFALWEMGFRPFFLLGAGAAVLLIPLWIGVLTGRVSTALRLSGVWWHAHEMLYGFAMAIVAGFLLTAVANWTRRRTARGWALVGLSALWVAGRVVLLVPAWLPDWLAIGLDVAFIPALLVAIAIPLVAARSVRNYGFIAILAAATVSNLWFHLSARGGDAAGVQRAQGLMLNLVLLMLLIVGGRIIPLFTRNAVGDATIQRDERASRLTLGAMLLLTVSELLGLAGLWIGLPALSTAALVLWRARRWGVRRTLREPLLWVLHLGNAWISVGLAVKAVSVLWPTLSPSLATHSLTIGAVSTLVLGMIVRVALGHTGRALTASRVSAVAFVLLTLATLVRVLVPLIWPGQLVASWWLASVLWVLAFTMYLLRFTSILLRPRVDGKAG